MLALLVVMLVSFSPTMTAAVITDTGARGRFSETVLAMVVLADLVVLLLFSFLMQIARVAFTDASAELTAILVRFAWEIGGAMSFGVLVGALFALYMRYVGREVTLVLLGACTVLSQVGEHASVRATPGGGRRRSGDREPGGRTGRYAARCRPARRSARPRGVLCGGWGLAQTGCSSDDRICRARIVHSPSGTDSRQPSSWLEAGWTR